MPSQILPDVGGEGANNEIKVKTFYNTEIMISYIQENITYEELCDEIRKNCRFAVDQPFTIKWIDEENDPCTLSTQMELDEAIRLHELNHNPELVIHVFLTIESKCVVSSETQKELKRRTIPETHPKSTIGCLPLKQKLYPKREKKKI
ncbi:hypothetical protein GQX74_006038, partial [Glossina fuscipes]